MKTEIDMAVNFLSNLIRNGITDSVLLTNFREALCQRFADSFESHWFPERPIRGNAYRCIRIVNRRMDKTIVQAGADVGLSESQLLSVFPPELTVWIDPYEVSYRIGEDGSVGVVYSVPQGAQPTGHLNSNQSSNNASGNTTPSLSVPSQSSSPTSESNENVNNSSSSSCVDYCSTMLSEVRVSPNTFNRAYIMQPVYS